MAQVQSLVWELGSLEPDGIIKEGKKKKKVHRRKREGLGYSFIITATLLLKHLTSLLGTHAQALQRLIHWVEMTHVHKHMDDIAVIP